MVMKGLIYTLLIMAFSFLIVLAGKILISKLINKKGSDNPTPKIYYVTKTHRKRRKDVGVNVPITVSGAVIEREKKH